MKECSSSDQATPDSDVMPANRGGVQESEAALPRASLASGIPRIVILDENAVFDHYMRRLNRVWMRRIKVCVLCVCSSLLYSSHAVFTGCPP